MRVRASDPSAQAPPPLGRVEPIADRVHVRRAGQGVLEDGLAAVPRPAEPLDESL
jgi:hypothetical protein